MLLNGVDISVYTQYNVLLHYAVFVSLCVSLRFLRHFFSVIFQCFCYNMMQFVLLQDAVPVTGLLSGDTVLVIKQWWMQSHDAGVSHN